ncbi:MAG: cyclic nucleotide-binding domain-containing protein [Actinomycetota bacterium]
MSIRHPNPKVERLSRLPLFAQADAKALTTVASAADEVAVPSGRALITQGHRHAEGFVIVSGTVEVEIDGEIVAEISDGEIVGELGLLDPGPATATVRAKTDLDVLVIPANRFSQIMDEVPSLVRAIANELARRLRAMDARTSIMPAAPAPDPDPRRLEPGEESPPLAQW